MAETASHTSNRIIGGMFGLEFPLVGGDAGSVRLPGFLTGRHIKLASARSAFRLLESFFVPETVWLPSYLCGVILDAFQRAHMRFYPVDRHLRLSSEEWLSDVKPNDMVMFIDYFGFLHWSDWGAEVRRRGAWVVEDACQSMLNTQWCEHSHYVIFSPRKFVGIPDGGILMARGECGLPEGELPLSPAAWWLEALAASVLRAEFDRHGGERQWFRLFQKSEAAAPIEPARMSELSELLLTHTIDFEAMARRRRDNFLLLAAALPELAIFSELPAEVVPLGFPIRVTQRDRVRQTLFQALVFPPVHWPLDGIVPEEFGESHRLSQEIMTLPCDQRYGARQLTRLADTIKSLASKP